MSREAGEEGECLPYASGGIALAPDFTGFQLPPLDRLAAHLHRHPELVSKSMAPAGYYTSRAIAPTVTGQSGYFQPTRYHRQIDP